MIEHIEQILFEVTARVKNLRPADAQTQLTSLLETVSNKDLKQWEVDIRKVIEEFYPKRRKQLTSLLDDRLGSPKQRQLAPAELEGHPAETSDTFRDDLRSRLRGLSDSHIFQWATEYRDQLLPLFARAIKTGQRREPESINEALREEFCEHTKEILAKGYDRARELGQDYALFKSASGLQKFLELAIEFHSTSVSRDIQGESATALRKVVSSVLRGILVGYACVEFGPVRGAGLLSRFSRSWAHYLPFFTAEDLSHALSRLPHSALTDSVYAVVLPVLAAIDELHSKDTDDKPLPLLGQFVREYSRLEIAIRPPLQAESPEPVELVCFLDPTAVSKIALQEAANRNVSVVLAELRPELQAFVAGNPSLKPALVNLTEMRNLPASIRRAVCDRLEFELYKKRSRLAAATPLSYNFARSFPLQNPFLTQYFRVRRHSVARLLKTFERRNGVRLWCSVRRSGKTTACFDLGAAGDETRVVSQTCDTTEQTPDASLFYEAVRNALTSGHDIPPDFVSTTVMKCAGNAAAKFERYVLILDEYETLFGRLKYAVKADPALRYTVVQPLLNQFVSFSRNNLVVLLGQQPDAHFILMDQNQLSGAVEQDAFPLFTHGSSDYAGEFRELVSRVLTERAVTHPSFLDALYTETRGHPFLTVKLLVDFVDWLIECRRKIGHLTFYDQDFDQFAKERLNRKRIAGSPEYAFFREAIAQAISGDGKTENQWLYCVYRIVRHIALQSPESLRISYTDASKFVNTLQREGLGVDADSVLASAMRANFLDINEDEVKPKIPLLARIAACTRIPQRG